MYRTAFVCLIVAGLVAAPATPTVAQEKKKVAELRWFGHSYFMLTTADGTKIVFDPHSIAEYRAKPVAPDIAIISHQHNDHNRREILLSADSKDLKVFEGVVVKGKSFDWAKVDETVKGIRIRNVPTYHDEEEGAKRGKNSIFIVEADGLKYAHLGDLGHELSDEQAKAIGPIDVLMIPVGGIYTINGEKAKRVVEQLKPRLFVIPMHFGTKVNMDVQPPDEFLEGQANVRNKANDDNLLPIPIDLKADKPTIVVLNWTGER